MGSTAVQWLVLLPHSKKLLDLILGIGPFCAVCVSPCVCIVPSKHSGFIPQSKNMQEGVQVIWFIAF